MHFSEVVIFVLSPLGITLSVQIRNDLDFFLMDSGCLVELGLFSNGENNHDRSLQSWC